MDSHARSPNERADLLSPFVDKDDWWVNPSAFRLLNTIPGLIDLQLDAMSPFTVLKYKFGWLWWRKCALSKIGVFVIPGKPFRHRALFISELAERSSENNTVVSSLESPVYAIKRGYAMANIEACPVRHPSQ